MSLYSMRVQLRGNYIKYVTICNLDTDFNYKSNKHNNVSIGAHYTKTANSLSK